MKTAAALGLRFKRIFYFIVKISDGLKNFSCSVYANRLAYGVSFFFLYFGVVSGILSKTRIAILITWKFKFWKITPTRWYINYPPPPKLNLVWMRWFIIAFNFIITVLQCLLLFEVNGARRVPRNALCKSLYFVRRFFTRLFFSDNYLV